MCSDATVADKVQSCCGSADEHGQPVCFLVKRATLGDRHYSAEGISGSSLSRSFRRALFKC